MTPNEPKIFSLTSPHKFSKMLGALAGMVPPLAGLEPGAMVSVMGFGVRWTWVRIPVSLLISIVALTR